MNFEVFIPIVLFISIVWIINKVVNRRALHKERVKAIESGADLSGLIEGANVGIANDWSSLKYGLLAIGVALGCLVGSILETYEALANPGVGYFFGIFFFAGIALVISHFMAKK